MKLQSLLFALIVMASIGYADDRADIFRNKFDYSFIAVKATTYSQYAPNVGRENPSFPVAQGMTMDILKDMGSYVYVKFSNGKKGYMSKDKNLAKLITAYGRVIHKGWRKSMESFLAGGSNYCILDTQGKVNKNFPGKFLRTSPFVSFAQIRKYTGKQVKIIGIADIPKGTKVNPRSQHPVGMKRSGTGKGIRVYKIWPMKETKNAMVVPLPKSFKGYELYGWTKGKQWYFCLITGTNRTKTFEEMAKVGEDVSRDWAKITVVGVKAIKNVLSRLPKGEEVFWGIIRKSDPVSGKKIKEDLKKFAHKLGIKFS